MTSLVKNFIVLYVGGAAKTEKLRKLQAPWLRYLYEIVGTDLSPGAMDKYLRRISPARTRGRVDDEADRALHDLLLASRSTRIHAGARNVQFRLRARVKLGSFRVFSRVRASNDPSIAHLANEILNRSI